MVCQGRKDVSDGASCLRSCFYAAIPLLARLNAIVRRSLLARYWVGTVLYPSGSCSRGCIRKNDTSVCAAVTIFVFYKLRNCGKVYTAVQTIRLFDKLRELQCTRVLCSLECPEAVVVGRTFFRFEKDAEALRADIALLSFAVAVCAYRKGTWHWGIDRGRDSCSLYADKYVHGCMIRLHHCACRPTSRPICNCVVLYS